MNDSESLGLSGMQRGLTKMQKATEIIANPNYADDVSTMTKAAIHLQHGKIQIEASAQVVKTSNDMVGSLLDIFV